MNRSARTRGIGAVVLAGCVGVTLAQSGGEYRLTRQAIASGGGSLAGGELSAEVTLAQPQAAMQVGGVWRLRGGFHIDTADGATPPVGDEIFQDGFER
jgi:hypothetical protein